MEKHERGDHQRGVHYDHQKRLPYETQPVLHRRYLLIPERIEGMSSEHTSTYRYIQFLAISKNDEFIVFARTSFVSCKDVHLLPFSVLYRGRYTLFSGPDNCKKLLMIDANVRPCKIETNLIYSTFQLRLTIYSQFFVCDFHFYFTVRITACRHM